jgi:cell volume regulation protein A
MYLLAAFILIAVVLMANMVSRWNVPLIIIALGMGIVFGSDVTGLVYFDNAVLAQQLANASLIFILFAGGFDTRRENIKSVIGPSMSLATFGVLITGSVTALVLWKLLHFDFIYALLISAIISSTDAAATFSILRTRAINSRLSSIVEVESAANDPMAIISTTFIIQLLVAGNQGPINTIFTFIWQLIGGIVLGLGIGHLGCILFNKIKNIDRGYFYILMIGIILLAFGLADILKASGMLSVFFAGYIMGNKRFPYKRDVSTFVEALSAVANVGVFILLGLLVFPKEFAGIWLPGVIVFLVLTFIGRPAAVLLCTILGGFSWKDRLFMSWSGIRGAVPIVLATYPLAAGIEHSHQIFNIIFFAVTLSVLIQGTTIGKLVSFLKLTTKTKPKPSHTMELVTMLESNLELIEVVIDEDFYTGQVAISLLDLPENTTITMINRKEEILAPSGSTILLPGDVLFILVVPQKANEVKHAIFKNFTRKDSTHT